MFKESSNQKRIEISLATHITMEEKVTLIERMILESFLIFLFKLLPDSKNKLNKKKIIL